MSNDELRSLRDRYDERIKAGEDRAKVICQRYIDGKIYIKQLKEGIDQIMKTKEKHTHYKAAFDMALGEDGP